MSTRPSWPWLTIPDAAQPGQPHAFADREPQLRALYRALVHAGNAVREGKSNIRHKHLVHGYKGVGKSALIMQVLGLLRGEITIKDPGQHTDVEEASLPAPQDPQRWLIFHLSGKHIANIEALGDQLAITSREAIEETDTTLDMVRTIHETANKYLPRVTRLPLIHRLLRKQESVLYKDVEQALEVLIHTLNYVAKWRGAVQTDRQTSTDSSERQSLKQIKTDLEARFGGSMGKGARAGLEAAASLIYKYGATLISDTSSEVERKWRVDAQLVTDALNQFFRATDAAHLPTLLVLDDFDEFASGIGPSHEQRARILSLILGPFQKLAPTCLVIGLRAEYLHEDLRRQYVETQVPAMTRAQFARVIEAWTELQEPPLPTEQVAQLNELTRHVLGGFDKVPDYDHETTRIAIPFALLRIIRHLIDTGASVEETPWDLLQGYVRDRYLPLEQRALEQVVRNMPDRDILACAAALPLEPGPYELGISDRRPLERSGLTRPAMASDPDDPTIIIDPLAAYLRTAQLLNEPTP